MKRGFSGGFGDEASTPKRRGGFTEATGDGPSAEAQLEAMLSGGSSNQMFGNIKVPDPGSLPGIDQEPRVATTPMDFSRPSQNQPSRDIPVPKGLVVALMTPGNRSVLVEQSGADVEWSPEESVVKVRGSAEQVKKASRLLQRVLMHCHWGKSEAKIRRLLKPFIVESAKCRLSPMNTLRAAEKMLNQSTPIMTIGKDKANDLTINDPIISRQHCVLELDPERGAVYALDTSTNGTFLNGIRLPSKQVGKVMLSHGDELLFKDPTSGDSEFGYIVNLDELHVKEEVKLAAPRRLLSPEEMTSTGRDFA